MTLRRLLTLLAVIVVLASGFVAGRASAAQPHMVAALEHLRAAKVELEVAEHDKAGHRAKALQLTKDAIAETELGIQAGRH
jgi:hypothetical protein